MQLSTSPAGPRCAPQAAPPQADKTQAVYNTLVPSCLALCAPSFPLESGWVRTNEKSENSGSASVLGPSSNMGNCSSEGRSKWVRAMADVSRRSKRVNFEEYKHAERQKGGRAPRAACAAWQRRYAPSEQQHGGQKRAAHARDRTLGGAAAGIPYVGPRRGRRHRPAGIMTPRSSRPPPVGAP